jgi:hypothetical protein
MTAWCPEPIPPATARRCCRYVEALLEAEHPGTRWTVTWTPPDVEPEIDQRATEPKN